MLEAGIIEPSNSNWSAPMIIVTRQDRPIRLCVDYRRLNTVSKMDAYPMPRIDDLIDGLGKAKYISTIDLRGGCAREHFGLEFTREMSVVCGRMQLKVGIVKKMFMMERLQAAMQF